MPPQKFVIHLSGPSCVGKSTLNQALGEIFPGIYTVSYDRQKWQLAGYNRDKDKETVKNITSGLYEVVLKMGLPVQLDFLCKDQAVYDGWKKAAEKYGYKFFSFELTAPMEVLLARFRERVERAKTGVAKISVTDENIFINETSKSPFLPVAVPSFDTSIMSPAEIAQKIAEVANKG